METYAEWQWIRQSGNKKQADVARDKGKKKKTWSMESEKLVCTSHKPINIWQVVCELILYLTKTYMTYNNNC